MTTPVLSVPLGSTSPQNPNPAEAEWSAETSRNRAVSSGTSVKISTGLQTQATLGENASAGRLLGGLNSWERPQYPERAGAAR
jgi:hypothetical protein